MITWKRLSSQICSCVMLAATLALAVSPAVLSQMEQSPQESDSGNYTPETPSDGQYNPPPQQEPFQNEQPAAYQNFSSNMQEPGGQTSGFDGYNPQSQGQGQMPYSRPTNGWVPLQQQQPPQLPPHLVMPLMLDTTLDLNGLKPGDYVQAHLAQNVSAGGPSYLPGGTLFYGQVGAEEEGHHFEKKGAKMGIEFVQIKMPNGTMIPIKAHLLGRLDNYLNNDGRAHGESFGQRMMSYGWRGGLGSGLASGFGSIFGAVADGGRGPGSGAFVGAAMGGGSGLMESMMYRRNHDTMMHAGTQLQIQLDAPVQLPWSNSGSNRYLPGTGRNTGIF